MGDYRVASNLLAQSIKITLNSKKCQVKTARTLDFRETKK